MLGDVRDLQVLDGYVRAAEEKLCQTHVSCCFLDYKFTRVVLIIILEYLELVFQDLDNKSRILETEVKVLKHRRREAENRYIVYDIKLRQLASFNKLRQRVEQHNYSATVIQILSLFDLITSKYPPPHLPHTHTNTNNKNPDGATTHAGANCRLEAQYPVANRFSCSREVKIGSSQFDEKADRRFEVFFSLSPNTLTCLCPGRL